jgi:CheY-like chemotaxis protein
VTYAIEPHQKRRQLEFKDCNALFIEPNRELRFLLHSYFEDWGIAATGLVTTDMFWLTVMDHMHHHLDFVCIDMDLPNMETMELIHRIEQRSELNETKVILMGSGKSLSRCDHPRVSLKVSKPLHQLEFKLSIHEMLYGVSDVPVQEEVAPQEQFTTTPEVVTTASIVKRVLVVDDHDENRDLMRTYLSKWNIPHVFAHHGLEAVEMCRAEWFDVILMDLRMPIMDGYQATENIRQLSDQYAQHEQIVALSASKPDEEKNSGANQLFNDMMDKPIDRKALKAYLERVLSS